VRQKKSVPGFDQAPSGNYPAAKKRLGVLIRFLQWRVSCVMRGQMRAVDLYVNDLERPR
jgi:hypothetical protein